MITSIITFISQEKIIYRIQQNDDLWNDRLKTLSLQTCKSYDTFILAIILRTYSKLYKVMTVLVSKQVSFNLP